MNKIQALVLKMAKPLIKRLLINTIKDNQVLVIQSLKNKVDIPKLSPEEEARLYVQMYDALETAAVTIIERI